MKKLLVAERFNLDGYPRIASHLRDVLYADPELYTGLMLEAGTFLVGPGRAKLASIGVEFHDSMNLCPPAPQSEPWDSETARVVASHVRERLAPSYDVVYLVGTRVARAFEMRPVALLHVDAPYITLPHPSGLNRWWNDPDNVSAAREVLCP